MLQPRFRSTNKNPGRKIKKIKPLSKPSQQEEDQLGYKKILIERFSKERN